MARLSRSEMREQTKQKLWESAINEISDLGFSGASIDKISEKAGFSRGAFYGYYKNKNELLLDLIANYHLEEAASWLDVVRSSASLEETLGALHQRFSQYASNDNWVRFNIEVILQAKRNPELSLQYQKNVIPLNERVKQLLTALFEQAGIEAKNDWSELIALVRAVTTGAIMEVGVHGSPQSAANNVIAFFRALLKD